MCIPAIESLAAAVQLFARTARSERAVEWARSVSEHCETVLVAARAAEWERARIALGCLALALTRDALLAPVELRPAVVELAAAAAVIQVALRGDTSASRAERVANDALQRWTSTQSTTPGATAAA